MRCAMSKRLARKVGVLLALAVPALFAPGALAQDPDVPTHVSGSAVFKVYCAVCHGKEAKGDGPLASSLRFAPSDLTLLAKRNGGTYPAELVFRIVDGRKPVKGHGGPDMPIWGDAFRNAETGYDDLQVKEKIRLVVEYLRTLQAPGR